MFGCSPVQTKMSPKGLPSAPADVVLPLLDKQAAIVAARH